MQAHFEEKITFFYFFIFGRQVRRIAAAYYTSFYGSNISIKINRVFSCQKGFWHLSFFN